MAYQYKFRNMPVVREQLYKGGLRLAALLNWIFAEESASPDGYRETASRIRELDGWDEAVSECRGGT